MTPTPRDTMDKDKDGEMTKWRTRGHGEDNNGGGGMVHSGCCEQLLTGCMEGCKNGTSTDNGNGTMGMRMAMGP